MAAPANCQHSYKVVKSDTTLIQWTCNRCLSTQHSTIYECQNCKLKTCEKCASKS
jgi:hypothetical protein